MTPRFSISNLLLLTAIVGLAIGWTLDKAQLNRRYQANTAALVHLMNQDIKQYGVIHTYFMNIAPPTLDKANQAVKDLQLVLNFMDRTTSAQMEQMQGIEIK